ncbi:MAG: sensor signal transduction histidine kinase [Acidobacteria bacterium]|nr:sensor signal transduction histidine kinase [Acidobacteriota bacterium]
METFRVCVQVCRMVDMPAGKKEFIPIGDGRPMDKPMLSFGELLHKVHLISRESDRPDWSLEGFLMQVAEILPWGWRHPEIAAARIVFDGQAYSTNGFRESPCCQDSPILVGGECRGNIQVTYPIKKPAPEEGPFLEEERSLLDEVARQVGFILERVEMERERTKLHAQLRHADHLATIGQLAAGAAHEINEPLASVLGFAQLAKCCPNLPAQADQEIEKIINAALHAREIVKKLITFSRQIPARSAACNVNDVIRESLYFLEARCLREGIRLVCRLAESLPEITADVAQLHQVVVNLVVNAIQAMPHGGILTVETRVHGRQILLAVEDTGTGMSEEVMKQIFIPFFTTKGAGHGTGLGLPAVHGIVTSHGGTIQVHSRPGLGSRFEVTLPVREVPHAKEID